MPTTPPSPRPHCRVLRRLGRLLLAAALAGGVAAVPPAAAAAAPAADAALAAASRELLGRVKGALEGRSAAGVVACMDPEGTLSLGLLGLPAGSGPLKRDQATRVLGSYFEGVSAPRLVERSGQAADSLVRTFDYTRRLRGGDPATTRLVVTLRRDAAGALRLAALAESAR
ncbi:MAG: hypothetical protein ACKOCB_03500 [Planctomycetia bacterium]